MSAGARRAGRIAAGFVALAMAVAACGGGDGDPLAAPTDSASPGAPGQPPSSTEPPAAAPDPATSAALAKFYDQKMTWDDCRSGFECSKLTVPLDYDEPEGKTLELAMIRLRAAGPGKRIGSLLINPGGPGGSGVEYARSSREHITAPVRARFDVVGFDPRGVGSSNPINCLTDAQLDVAIGADATPDTPEEIEILEREAERLAKGCQRRSGEMLPHLGTPDVARDLDVMRAALGDKKLNFLGKSYGTYIGAFYAELFPTRVGRLVLDGALDPRLSGDELTTDQIRGFQVAYENFVAGCLKSISCPLGDSEKQVTEFISDFLDDVDGKPVSTRSGRDLNESLAMIGILVAMYDEGAWSYLADAIVQADDGDGTALLFLADLYIDRESDGTYKNNSNEVIYAVNCLDHPGDDSPEAIQAKIPAMREISPLWGEFIAWGNLPCHYWPVQSGAEPGPLTARGAGPIVVIGTTRDPATPFAWAEGLAEQLESGILLAFRGDGHTAYGRGNRCLDNAVDAYFLRGKAPKDGKRCG